MGEVLVYGRSLPIFEAVSPHRFTHIALLEQG